MKAYEVLADFVVGNTRYKTGEIVELPDYQAKQINQIISDNPDLAYEVLKQTEDIKKEKDKK